MPAVLLQAVLREQELRRKDVHHRINYDYQASTSFLALPADALESPSVLVVLGCFFDEYQPGDILQLAPAFYLPHNIRYNQQFPATSAERLEDTDAMLAASSLHQ